MPNSFRTSPLNPDPVDRASPRVSPLLQSQSFKSWLVLLVATGLFLYLLSHFNYLLFHVAVELTSIALGLAVFTVGWNTRLLVQSSSLLILATGFSAAALPDLLHTLSYRGMGVFPESGVNQATQFWIAARYLYGIAFLLSMQSLGRRWAVGARPWLCGFLCAALILVACIWPLGIFPVCYIDGQGLTAFKKVSEFLVAVMMAVAAGILWRRSQAWPHRMVKLLLTAILFNVLSGLSFTLYHDVYGFANFLGHYFKLVSVLIVYAALVKGTLRNPYNTLFRELSASHEELAIELKRRRKIESEKQLVNQEFSLLYRFARTFHSTLQLDALSHLVLSAATAPDGGGFGRAMLFTVNERTRTVQGMLGVDVLGSGLVLPMDGLDQAWDKPRLDKSTIEAQRTTDFNRRVVKQRLPLDIDDNPLARAYLYCQVVLVPDPEEQSASMKSMVDELRLGQAACVPLLGRHQVMGVLVVDAPRQDVEIAPDRLRFLEMFARQAGDAMENAQLLHRLEQAHEDLRDVQERLIEGEKLSVLGEMAAQVAHELKNPLVSIGGFAQRLSRLELGDAKANDYAAIIAREVRRLEEMLGNILAFSKKQLVCLEETDLEALVHEAVELERENCHRQRIEVRVDLPAHLPEVTGDSQQLRQVLHNLIINARQAMQNGGQLTLRAYSGLLRGDEAVMVEVEDTGGGIAPDVMRNIFNPFFSTQAKGTGLGLSISHRIIAHHHGEIEVINSEKGARFTVRLPLLPPRVSSH